MYMLLMICIALITVIEDGIIMLDGAGIVTIHGMTLGTILGTTRLLIIVGIVHGTVLTTTVLGTGVGVAGMEADTGDITTIITINHIIPTIQDLYTIAVPDVHREEVDMEDTAQVDIVRAEIIVPEGTLHLM